LDPLYLLAVLATTLPVWATARVNLRPLLPQLTAIGLTLVSLMLFIFSFSGAVGTSAHVADGQPAISLGPLAFYPASFDIGAVQLLRMGIPMLTSLLVFATTDPTAFARALDRLRVPREISFMIVTALRFFPMVLEEYTNVLQAQKVRGARPTGLLNRLRFFQRMSLPLLVIMLRKSRDMGIAAEGRAFGARQWHGTLRELRLGRNDLAFMLVIALGVAIGLYVRIGLGLGWSWVI
jgi:energy-coupling factor transport system permease protein